MKTAGRRNPNRWAIMPRTPSLWRGRSKRLSLVHVGWEARKTPAAGEVFFLDFPLYRTSQDLAAVPSDVAPSQPIFEDSLSVSCSLRIRELVSLISCA